MPAEIFTNRVTTTVQTELMPFVVDTVLNSNVLAQIMIRGAKKWNGRRMEIPVKISKNATGQSFRGFDVLSTTATDNRQKLVFDPKFYSIASVLPLDEMSIADTENAVINLVSATLRSDAQDMADDVGTLFYGTGTGNGGKDFLGLAALVDDGTTVASIGGLSRATYTTLQSTKTASGGNLSLALVDAQWNAATSGSQTPTMFITTETVWSLFGQLLRPQEQITKSVGVSRSARDIEGGTGFTAMFYKGKPILQDEKCTSGYFYALNENYLGFKALPVSGAKAVQYSNDVIKGNDYDAPMGLGFSWSEWVKPTNAAAYIGHIYLGGEFITDNPKRSAVITGVTGV